MQMLAKLLEKVGLLLGEIDWHGQDSVAFFSALARLGQLCQRKNNLLVTFAKSS